MKKLFARYVRDETGAVTVDWVVLTAAIGFLGMAVVLMIREAATEPASAIGNVVGAMTIGTN